MSTNEEATEEQVTKIAYWNIGPDYTGPEMNDSNSKIIKKLTEKLDSALDLNAENNRLVNVMTVEIGSLKQAKDALSRYIAQLQSEVGRLKEEGEEKNMHISRLQFRADDWESQHRFSLAMIEGMKLRKQEAKWKILLLEGERTVNHRNLTFKTTQIEFLQRELKAAREEGIDEKTARTLKTYDDLMIEYQEDIKRLRSEQKEVGSCINPTPPCTAGIPKVWVRPRDLRGQTWWNRMQ